MKKTIKWGIVGPGSIAKKFAKAVKNVEGAELFAVASRSYERSKEFAEEFDIPNVFGSYEEMANCDEIDAVYIATLHPFHKPCSEIFLNAKKHVLCEKPVCVNAKEARELFECAKKNNVFLMEAMWTRFLPAIQEAVKIAKSGEIGEIRGVSADFCYPHHLRENALGMPLSFPRTSFLERSLRRSSKPFQARLPPLLCSLPGFRSCN